MRIEGYLGKIGVDESGKGDYFGPLVIAGVYISEGMREEVELMGVKDSKKLGDGKVKELSYKIKRMVGGGKYNIVTIGPERYNELYSRMNNLNQMLGWGHARVIENLLEGVDCGRVLSDKFGNERYIKNALLSRGKKVELEQRIKGEEDIAVASASILARQAFLNYMDQLSKAYGVKIPKGASRRVDEIGRMLVQRRGVEILKRVAKLHFRTTDKIMKGL